VTFAPRSIERPEGEEAAARRDNTNTIAISPSRIALTVSGRNLSTVCVRSAGGNHQPKHDYRNSENIQKRRNRANQTKGSHLVKLSIYLEEAAFLISCQRGAERNVLPRFDRESFRRFDVNSAAEV